MLNLISFYIPTALRIDRFRLYSASRSKRVITLNAPRLYDAVADSIIIRIGIRLGIDNPGRGASWSGYLSYALKSNEISKEF
jgi:hypothetical protein